MPRVCTVCVHPDREAIDAALVGGIAVPALSREYGLSEDALTRHRSRHLPAAMLKARAANEATLAADLLAKVAALEADAKRLGAQAEKAGDLRTALGAVRELVRIVELLAKLRGELDERPQVNILVSAQWQNIRRTLLVALEPYPQARAAVSESLLELELAT